MKKIAIKYTLLTVSVGTLITSTTYAAIQLPTPDWIEGSRGKVYGSLVWNKVKEDRKDIEDTQINQGSAAAKAKLLEKINEQMNIPIGWNKELKANYVFELLSDHASRHPMSIFSDKEELKSLLVGWLGNRFSWVELLELMRNLDYADLYMHVSDPCKCPESQPKIPVMPPASTTILP